MPVPFTRVFAFVLASLLVVGRPAIAQVRIDAAGRGPAGLGWVRAANRLLLTQDAGRTWADVSPAPDHGTLDDAVVAPDGTLWSVSHGPELPAGVRVHRSRDLGRAWTGASLALADFEPGAASLAALSAAEAWVLVRRASNVNFSDGELFRTTNGGADWARLPAPPVAGALAFASATTGMLVGGATGREVFDTGDGGRTWRRLATPGPWADEQDVFLSPPTAISGGWVVVASAGDDRERHISKLTWSAEGGALESTPLARWAASPGVAAAGRRDALDLAVRVVRQAGPGWRARNVPLTGDIVAADVDVRARGDAWILLRSGACAGAKSACSESTSLWAVTPDDDVAREMTPPFTSSGSAVSGARDVGVSQNKGFDKCTAASVSSLQTWWNESPYRDVNIYIGGASRGCSQPLLTPAWVRDVFAQGWRLIPTWVGYQAPCTTCTSCRNRFSANPAEAEAEGVREADRASDVASGLGLVPQTVVYLDIEAYASNDRPCRDAVSAFVNGWGRRMRERGNVAGVYGSATNASQDWTGIAHRPDAVWIGKWDLRDTVWGLTPLSDTEWAAQQRIHQYRGGHDETWGGVTFNIDNDVEDGPVAAPAGVAVPDTTAPDVVIESPANDSLLTASPVAVRGSASDADRGDSGISRVTVNGVVASGGTAEGRDVASWSADVPLGSGTHDLVVEATDASAARNVARRTVRVTIGVAPTDPAPPGPAPSPTPIPTPTLPAAPTVIADGLTDPRGLWLEEAAVYWIDGTGVLGRTPFTGPAQAVRLDEALASPTAVTGDPRAVFVADARGLWRYERHLADVSTFAPPALLLADAGDVTSLAVADDLLFWTERASGLVRRLHVPSGEVTVIATSTAPTSLRRSGERVVWIEAAPRGSVWSSDLAGADVRRLADGTNTPGLFVENGRIVWAQMDDEGDAGRLRAVSIDGGESRVVVEGVRRPWSVTQAGGGLYWTESRNDGTVWRAAADGSAATRIAVHLAEPTSLAANDRVVVWIERAAGEPGRGRVVALSPATAAGNTPGVFQ